MRFIRFLLAALALGLGLLPNSLQSQSLAPPTGMRDHTPSVHAFTNCTLVTAPGMIVENGILVVRDGRVESAGADAVIPKDALVHDLRGQWIYPAFIDIWSDYGQSPTKPAKHSYNSPPQYQTHTKGPYSWNQAVKPETEVEKAFTPDAKKAAQLRKEGFGLVQSVPMDGIFRGTASLVHTGDGKANEILLVPKSGACLSFRKGSSTQNYPSSLMGAIALIRQTLLDAQWYEKAHSLWGQNNAQPRPEVDLSLSTIQEQIKSGIPLFFESRDYQTTLRAAKIANEFNLKFIYKTTGDEYKRIPELKATGAAFIVPLKFPKAYDLKDIANAREISLARLRDWEQAPMNPAVLAKEGIPFAITQRGLKKDEFWPALEKAISYGLSPEQALAALSISPAKILGIDAQVGTLDPGKRANFLITSPKIFASKKPTIFETWVGGKQYTHTAIPEFDPRGEYALNIDGRRHRLLISGSLHQPQAKVVFQPDTLKTTMELEGRSIILGFENKKGTEHTRLSGIWQDKNFKGTGVNAQGKRITWEALLDVPFKPKAEKQNLIQAVDLSEISPVTFPNMAYGLKSQPKTQDILIRNVTVWTNTASGMLENTDVLILKGKVEKVGKDLKLPKEGITIDGTGKHLTPGIIDEHSHIAISRGVNEGTHAVTAEVSIGDVVNGVDINIYRQLAGGVTTSQLLHGSANPIGGQSGIIKLRWGMLPEEMKFEGAAGFIKFALGENVKQSNWGEKFKIRYPQSRAGVEQVMTDAFQTAMDYRKAWKDWTDKGGESSNLIPPQRVLQFEVLLEILDKKRFVTCHSYVQSEITMLMRLAESFGFRINTFTHILEGYKIADKLAAHGASGSTFSDWWAYKYEVIDAIPYNAAIMHEQGVNVCINSDDAEMGRRLNQEAAKAIKYGGVSEQDALKMVTLNPAKALHLDHRVGSIQKGMDADLVLWTDHPLSVYARSQKTLVDGKVLFDLEKDAEMRKQIQEERSRLIRKMMADKSGPKLPPGKKKGNPEYHCETLESDYNHE